MADRGVVAPVAYGGCEFDALDVRSVKHGIKNSRNVEIYLTNHRWITVWGGDRATIASEIDGARFDAWIDHPWQDKPPEPIE